MLFKLVAQRKASCIASLTSITVFSCALIKRVFKCFLPLRVSSKVITQYHQNTGDGPLHTSLETSLNTREVIYHINNV